MALIIGPLWLWNPVPRSIVIGAGVYLTYSWGSRFFLTRSHRQGIRLIREGRFEEAIPLFERSFQFFTRHDWLDRYRAVTMLSSSAMGYREMALCNLGFCYSQLDQGAKAKEFYGAVQAEYPHNVIAPIALRMIASGEQISTESKSSL